MTFNDFYKKVNEISGVEAPRHFVKILWHYGYTIEQAVHTLQTKND